MMTLQFALLMSGGACVALSPFQVKFPSFHTHINPCHSSNTWVSTATAPNLIPDVLVFGVARPMMS